MKVYCFYIRGDTDIDLLDEVGIKADTIEVDDFGNQFSLYAFTNKKSIRSSFIEQRNMDIFFMKVYEDTESNYEEFSNNFSEYELDMHELQTRKVNHMGFINPTQIAFACTQKEYDSLEVEKEDVFYNELVNMVSGFGDETDTFMIISDCLNDELTDILVTIFLLDDIIPQVYPYEEYPKDSVMVDELSLFIKLFSNTMRKRW